MEELAQTISEEEFSRMCINICKDIDQIRSWNPSLSTRDAFLWMLLGCLVSFLSVPILDQPSVYNPKAHDPYLDAVLAVLRDRTNPLFDPRAQLALFIPEA
jgi:hypothetical protein